MPEGYQNFIDCFLDYLVGYSTLRIKLATLVLLIVSVAWLVFLAFLNLFGSLLEGLRSQDEAK